jgi:hypothetical protein
MRMPRKSIPIDYTEEETIMRREGCNISLAARNKNLGYNLTLFFS